MSANGQKGLLTKWQLKLEQMGITRRNKTDEWFVDVSNVMMSMTRWWTYKGKRSDAKSRAQNQL